MAGAVAAAGEIGGVSANENNQGFGLLQNSLVKPMGSVMSVPFV